MNGYQFNSNFFAGVGVGLHLHSFQNEGSGEQSFLYSNDQYSMIPIYAQLRFMPSTRRIAPFFSVNGGYGLGVDLFNYWGSSDGNMEGGLLAGAAAGVQIATRKRMGFLFFMNYNFQQASSQRNDLSGFFRLTDINFHRILLGIGWSF
ncbi:MAG: hypothetical protein AAFO94_21920 [Bacteroidota bacterium]